MDWRGTHGANYNPPPLILIQNGTHKANNSCWPPKIYMYAMDSKVYLSIDAIIAIAQPVLIFAYKDYIF